MIGQTEVDGIEVRELPPSHDDEVEREIRLAYERGVGDRLMTLIVGLAFGAVGGAILTVLVL